MAVKVFRKSGGTLKEISYEKAAKTLVDHGFLFVSEPAGAVVAIFSPESWEYTEIES